MPLVGGDVNVGENVVVRVGDTVRRPVGPHTDATSRAPPPLRDRSASRERRASLGFDERGREVLTYVEGEPALRAARPDDETSAALGALIRRMHDAQAGFEPPPDWHEEPLDPPAGVTRAARWSATTTSFPPNVILRDGLPVGPRRLGLRRAGVAPVRRRLGGELLGAAAARRAGRALGPRRPAPRRAAPPPLRRATGSRRPSVVELLDVVAASEPDGLRDPPAERRRAPAARLEGDVGPRAAAT